MIKIAHGTIFTNCGHEICVCSTKPLPLSCMLTVW